ncbi:MAG: endolytic transglycosylase MltG [Chloracidobacterium sp.]|uniref:Endolytic murein transglycosylase n=1 Tax=Chloracidobacterium validum TaxID=2821543 RepID=A0ABX8BCS4_9BACT|nr:endolytic transglycosylase MltG [Chloracidobacterium validum]QUW03448.1 endolytic transglycosylase MltG [Chloracidobacterium validum]
MAHLRRRIVGLAILLVALMVAIGVGVSAYQSLRQPVSHRAAEELITVEPGMGAREVVNLLYERGVITNRYPVLLYLLINPVGRRLQAGDYEFESPISPVAALDKIRRGAVATRKIMFRPGLTIYEVNELLPNRPPEGKLDPALLDVRLIADLDPTARSLEGYIFPDTYIVPKRATNAEILAEAVARFRRAWTPELRQRAEGCRLTVREVVTLASLIEEEAADDAERPLVSSVFHNRLRRGMRLECDPTFIYGAKLNATWDGNVNNPAHRRLLSPYNTYLYPGLPPGPIASPSEKSLRAALQPATTDYFYFVLSAGGRHRFSRNETEHQAAVAEYRKLQQVQRQSLHTQDINKK